jgi:Holliday junction DNA helicase RuvA
MIASLRGQVVYKDTQSAVIECAGVGYGVALSLPSLSRLGEVGAEAFVLIHTHVTEDSLRLFGFAEATERKVFELLLATAGVGPRLALAILSTLGPTELSDAVATGDKTSLTRIPGVGSKKAERLLIELKDRLKHIPTSSTRAPISSVLADLQSAMMNLGFALPVAEKAARLATEQMPQETDLAALVRAALRSTTSRGAS